MVGKTVTVINSIRHHRTELVGNGLKAKLSRADIERWWQTLLVQAATLDG